MSKKLKPNFTPIPNVILDEIMRRISGADLKKILMTCREGDEVRIQGAIDRALQNAQKRAARHER
ncbi:MAG: hypothetical protein Q8S00_26420 [Deltaproteobacteria bacterium]|nr:hypothetical protein [Deltaproteobacteria bacterium]